MAMLLATVLSVFHMAETGSDDPPTNGRVLPDRSHAHDIRSRAASQGTLDRIDRQRRDAALIVRIRADDEKALEELVHTYGLQLSGLAASVLGTNAFAEDIVQDVFIGLWERRRELEIPASVAGYLHRAVQYRSISVRRHELAHTRLEARLSADDSGTTVSHNTAEGQLEDADVAAELHAALAEISPSPRRVFLLCWSGLSYQEIAEVMGMTRASVRQQMYRATTELARMFRRNTP